MEIEWQGEETPFRVYTDMFLYGVRIKEPIPKPTREEILKYKINILKSKNKTTRFCIMDFE